MKDGKPVISSIFDMNTKYLFLLLFFLMMPFTSNAQGVTMEISGIVVDENGNPLPGAIVETAGGINTTETLADGTFKMEVSRFLQTIMVRFPSMFDEKVRLKNKDFSHLVVKMEEDYYYSPKGLKGNMIISGTIVDKDGNLLAGAKIEVPKSNLSTISDADGSFSIEIPRSTESFIVIYPGLGKKTVYPRGRNDKPFVVRIK